MKYNLSAIFKKSETSDAIRVQLTNNNYTKIYKDVAVSYNILSTATMNPNLLFIPPSYYTIDLDETFRKKMTKKIKDSNINDEVKKFAIEHFSKNLVAYNQSGYLPKIPIVYLKANNEANSYIVLNAIQKAFSYFIDDDINIIDETKAEKLLYYAYYSQYFMFDKFQKILFEDPEPLYHLFKNIFIDSIGISSKTYNDKINEIGLILIKYIYNVNIFPNYSNSIKSLQKRICELNDIEYKEDFNYIPTLTNMIIQLSKLGIGIDYKQTLFRLVKIHFWLPYLLSNGFGIFHLYLQTYMHIPDLGFPKIFNIAPIPQMKTFAKK